MKIDDQNTFIIGRSGPVIKSTDEDGKVSFKSVKENVDIKKIENGELGLDEIVEKDSQRILGVYEGIEMVVKRGKYGIYVQWGDNRKSIKTNRPIENITLEEAVLQIKDKEKMDGESENKFVRKINDNLSIRRGKNDSLYIFFKTKTMKKPSFFTFNGFKGDCQMCDLTVLKEWIKGKYNVF